MKPFYFILFIIIFLSACKKEKIDAPAGPYLPIQIPCKLSNNIDTLKNLIQGTWEWKQETHSPWGYTDTTYLTPQNQGYSLVVVFASDSTVKYYKDNKLTSVNKYKIEPYSAISGFHEDKMPVLDYYNMYTNLLENFVPISGCNNYLVLRYDIVSDVTGQYIFIKK